MAELTTKRRNALPAKKFGLPGQEKYPMPDRKHAANAKARAKQMLDKGKLSSQDYHHIVTKANAILSK